jgi:hypothetical protein
MEPEPTGENAGTLKRAESTLDGNTRAEILSPSWDGARAGRGKRQAPEADKEYAGRVFGRRERKSQARPEKTLQVQPTQRISSEHSTFDRQS